MGVGPAIPKVVDGRPPDAFRFWPGLKLRGYLPGSSQFCGITKDRRNEKRQTLSFHSSRCSFAFGFSKLMLGGIWPFSSASATLMMAATPLAVSVWPIFVLTEPILKGWSSVLVSLKTEAMA